MNDFILKHMNSLFHIKIHLGTNFECIKAIRISKKSTQYPKKINESQDSFSKVSQWVPYTDHLQWRMISCTAMNRVTQ